MVQLTVFILGFVRECLKCGNKQVRRAWERKSLESETSVG